MFEQNINPEEWTIHDETIHHFVLESTKYPWKGKHFKVWIDKLDPAHSTLELFKNFNKDQYVLDNLEYKKANGWKYELPDCSELTDAAQGLFEDLFILAKNFSA